MFRKIVSLTLALLMILSLGVTAYAEEPAPSSLEKPISFSVRDNEGELRIRWTNPKSINDIFKNKDEAVYEEYIELFYVVDWKKNDGEWNIGKTPADPNFNYDAENYFFDYLNASDELYDIFFVTWHMDPNDDSGAFDLVNNTYYFRMRYVLYFPDGERETVYSPYTDVIAIGKDANATAITKLDAPQNLTVEVKKYDGKPYFQLNWTNPQSVVEANKQIPVYHKIDFKVGNGPWLSESTSWDWMPSGSESGMSSDTFDPVEKNIVDAVVIEENTYYFRIAYEGEITTSNSLYSAYSNIASTKVEAYSNASNWAKGELDKAAEYDLIPKSLKGADMTKPITREEFAELAVRLYEKTTGKTAQPVNPNPFKDTTNQEILKAFSLKITDGTSATTFDPNKLINREQVATMLSRAIRQMVPTADFSIDGAPKFNDEAKISSWALEHVKYMSKVGIIKGSDGNFMPKAITSAEIASGYANTTREQAIAMSVRSYEQYGANGN